MTHPLVDRLGQNFPGGVVEANEALGELTIVVRAERIVDILRFLRDDPDAAYNQLSDVTAVDWPERAERFDMVYHLNALGHKRRLRVKARVGEPDAAIDSVCSVFRLAEFGEREVYDLFGIRFRGHPDLRRIFLPEDYDGHPLRKDYPTEGKGWRTEMEFIPIGPIPDGKG